MKSFRYCYLIILTIVSITSLANENKHLFPIENYNQNVDNWLNPKNINYTKELLTPKLQMISFINLKHRYFGTNESDPSPWNTLYISKLLNTGSAVYDAQNYYLKQFDNTQIRDKNKMGFGMNGRPISNKWISQIRENINLNQFKQLSVKDANRAIIVENTLARLLPTNDPFFYNENIAGEGYPFDNLQDSALYIGTPVYIMGQSLDGQWDLVLSPNLIAWVSANTVALVDNKFIGTWQNSAYNNLAGVSNNQVSISAVTGQYLATLYVGVLLPLVQKNNNTSEVLFPYKVHAKAGIKIAQISSSNIVKLPLLVNRKNFAKIFKVMQLRPYGWGNIGMYNDCSSEIKNIFALFGIFIPRNTSSIDNAGQVIDISNLDAVSRSKYLLSNGVPFLTLIHIKGHVMLYIGEYSQNSANGEIDSYPLSYQQIWGLRPADNSYRSIIGQSVFLPLWFKYPEDQNLRSQLDAKTFKLIYLNDINYSVPNLHDLLY